MFTPYLLHFPKNNTSIITTPHIVIYSPKEPLKKPWHITANEGRTTEGTNHITLEKNVLIHQPTGPQNSELSIKTEQLFIESKSNIAESPKLVTFTEPGITVTSLGMRAFLKEKRVLLLAQAKGVYDASQVENKSH
jgi:LPS export ABC transporter protein LptC